MATAMACTQAIGMARQVWSYYLFNALLMPATTAVVSAQPRKASGWVCQLRTSAAACPRWRPTAAPESPVPQGAVVVIAASGYWRTTFGVRDKEGCCRACC